MNKHFVLTSIAVFAVVGAVCAAPTRRSAEVPQIPIAPTEEVVGNNDERPSVPDLTQPLDGKGQGCGCDKPKKMRK